ncbi:hypothetical protein HDU77_007241 [Chytriomyces hyalinus]|nr:hypothetical protein HDU77_007241 [Chytriomyces hyalinus]
MEMDDDPPKRRVRVLADETFMDPQFIPFPAVPVQRHSASNKDLPRIPTDDDLSDTLLPLRQAKRRGAHLPRMSLEDEPGAGSASSLSSSRGGRMKEEDDLDEEGLRLCSDWMQGPDLFNLQNFTTPVLSIASQTYDASVAVASSAGEGVVGDDGGTAVVEPEEFVRQASVQRVFMEAGSTVMRLDQDCIHIPTGQFFRTRPRGPRNDQVESDAANDSEAKKIWTTIGSVWGVEDVQGSVDVDRCWGVGDGRGFLRGARVAVYSECEELGLKVARLTSVGGALVSDGVGVVGEVLNVQWVSYGGTHASSRGSSRRNLYVANGGRKRFSALQENSSASEAGKSSYSDRRIDSAIVMDELSTSSSGSSGSSVKSLSNDADVSLDRVWFHEFFDSSLLSPHSNRKTHHIVSFVPLAGYFDPIHELRTYWNASSKGTRPRAFLDRSNSSPTLTVVSALTAKQLKRISTASTSDTFSLSSPTTTLARSYSLKSSSRLSFVQDPESPQSTTSFTFTSLNRKASVSSSKFVSSMGNLARRSTGSSHIITAPLRSAVSSPRIDNIPMARSSTFHPPSTVHTRSHSFAGPASNHNSNSTSNTAKASDSQEIGTDREKPAKFQLGGIIFPPTAIMKRVGTVPKLSMPDMNHRGVSSRGHESYESKDERFQSDPLRDYKRLSVQVPRLVLTGLNEDSKDHLEDLFQL